MRIAVVGAGTAGSEASTLPNYIEGAVRAGERAADEVLSAG
jgi:monoamine oxidase